MHAGLQELMTINHIIAFPDAPNTRQSELPLKWWHETNLWREREHVSAVRRPTEDMALDNIYYASRAAGGKYGRDLNGLERKVYFLERLSRQQCPRYYTDTERQQWVANKTGLSIHAVKDVLHGVDIVIRELLRLQDMAVEYRWKQAAKEILEELAAEYAALDAV